MSGPSKDFASPIEDSTSQEGEQNRRLKVTLLSSEWRSSTDREVSTIVRALAVQLAKYPNVEVSVFLPKCSEEDRRNAASHKIQLIEADKLSGFEPILWLLSMPRNHDVDCVIGHGVHLGRQIQLIKKNKDCRWIQVVHSIHEEEGMYKNILEGERLQQTEVELCQMADQVVAIGPKVARTYEHYLSFAKEEETILDLTPGVFSEFLDVAQATDERKTFCVLVIGSGDSCEDFNVKGFNMAAEAIAELKDPSYKLKFLYSPKEKAEEIAEKLLQHGISRNQLIVRSFNDEREVLANLFCEVDLTIMPSRTEGFGLPGLEALSAGLPVLVSGNSGLGEALKEVPLGSQCVVDSEDPKDWAKGIRDVRQKPRRVRLSEAKILREHYAETYDWEKPCTVLVKKMQTLAFGSSESRSALPIRENRPTSVPVTSQADRRLREELTDGTYREGSSKIRSTTPVRNKRRAITDQPSKRLRQELTPHNQHGALEGSSGCHFQDSSLEYGQFPSAPDKLRYPRKNIQSCKNPTSEEGDLSEDRALCLLTEFLKKEYNRRALIKPLLWDSNFRLRLDDVYTRLSIVSRRITDFKLEDNEVNMFDIFNTLNKGDDSIVLVEGSPGMGKTTFCLKISHDWANKKIPDESTFPIFKLVLLLKCRDIHGNVCEAIFDQLFPNDMKKKAKKRLLDYFEDIHNQPSILIILDGLDELPETAESHVKELLDRQLWSFCYILATSRQEKGILMRQNGNFAVLLQIKGFTEADAFQYIRKHFGPDNEAKGDKLIQAIQENTFLHALPSNPLNLLLLCVVFEDYEGNLPSSRTELYRIIVRCLLRRYCAKNNVNASADDKALEEQFKDSLLALGQLAWRCLKKDLFSFRERKLAKFESKMKTLAARKLGLVFKEASAKKINPQHEYHFFHKTFQEFLAALYLAHKLLNEKINVFRNLKLSFGNITSTYKQVFIFVSGILGEVACNLVRQIGENLETECWNWLVCTQEEATFFTECFSESGKEEQMAMTLCSFVPFPQSITIDRRNEKNLCQGVLSFANACKSFSQLQLPVHFTVHDLAFERMDSVSVYEFLASYSRLETVFFSFRTVTEERTLLVCTALQLHSSLHSFTLQTVCPFPREKVVAIGDSLAANKTLQTVTLKLLGELDGDWATLLEKGLSGDTPLTFVVLQISGSLRQSGKNALKNLLLNRSLKSLSLATYGDMHDSLATSVGEGLAADPCLQSLTLIVNGSISCSAFTSLKKGVLENSALKSLELKVFGGLPGNWVNICKALQVAKNSSSMSLTIKPDLASKITTLQVACLRPVVEERVGVLKLHSFTVNMWGELTCSGASDLCKLLIASRVSFVNFNIHGRVTDSVATCLVENFDKVNSCPLSDLSINIRGELTRDGNSTLRSLKCNQTFSFTLNVQDVNAVDEIYDEVELYGVDSSSLKAAFTKFESICSRVSKLSLNLDNPSESSGVDWEYVGDVLAKFLSLATLSLSFSNYGGIHEGWMGSLWSVLAQNTSITTLSITVNVYIDEGDDWADGLRSGLAQNTSVTTLSITVNNYSRMVREYAGSPSIHLAENTSITTLSITINNYNYISGDLIGNLLRGLGENTSVTTLSITLSNYNADCLWRWLGENTSVTMLNVTFSYNSTMSRRFRDPVWIGLAENTSVTTLSITVSNCSERGKEFVGVLNVLGINTSVTTLSLTVNNYICSSEDLTSGLLIGLSEKTSITTLSITVNNYSNMSGDWAGGVGRSLAENRSITTLSITVNNYSDMSGDWAGNLWSGLAQNTSLASLNLVFNNHDNSYVDSIYKLGQALAMKNSSIKICLEVNVFGERNEKSEMGLA